MNRPFPLLAALALLACSHGSDSEITAPTRETSWLSGSFTQPVPSWGSPVRLSLPVAVNDILLGPSYSLGAFGAHQGGHVEGLDHVWIPTKLGIPVRSWAAGTVTKIQDMGLRGTADQRHEYFVTIDYGEGLIGQHMDVDQPLVKVGDRVKEGDAVGAMSGSAEFMLVDNRRTDGERTGGGTGSNVSPFDYLRDDAKAALLAKHNAEVVIPYFSRGVASGNARPWEPLLTNPMFFHESNRGTVVGEWILTNRNWKVPDPSYFDLLVVFDVTNAYGHFRRVELMDHDWSLPASKGVQSGSWAAGSEPGTMVVTSDDRYQQPWYARYRVDEGSGRAKLTIEWQRGGYPAAITSSAAVYTERAHLYLAADVSALGLGK